MYFYIIIFYTDSNIVYNGTLEMREKDISVAMEVHMKEKKKILIITMNAKAGHLYSETILNILGREHIETLAYTADEYRRIEHIDNISLYLISKSAIESAGDISYNVPLGVPVVDIRIDFKKEDIEKLRCIPKGSKCMLANSTELLCLECIVSLHQHGIHNIHFIPVYPGLSEIPNVDIAFTPGEPQIIPKGVVNIFDPGHRYLTLGTICEIAIGINMEYVLTSSSFTEYANMFEAVNIYSDEFFRRSIQLNKQIDIIVNGMEGGVIGINESNKVFCINSDAISILNLNIKQSIGIDYNDIMPFLDIKKYMYSGRNSANIVVSYNEIDLNVTIKTIMENTKYRGVLVMIERFIDAENKQQNARMKTFDRGHSAKYQFCDIVGNSKKIHDIRMLAEKMAVTNAAVLITGESGTGKELLASSIHNHSLRSKYPYIAINCAAMPENLLESELFGYEEGAFTGAKKGGKLGLFEYAHKGTIFLDEIEDMSPALQVKLLRVLQEKEVMRVGGNKIINVDVRIIAATNVDIESMVESGKIRRDLYYRLNTMQLTLPALRDRNDDIPILTEYIIKDIGGKFKLGDDVMEAFLTHKWEGNVRELRNYLEFFQCLCKNIITMKDLPDNLSKKLSKYSSYSSVSNFTLDKKYENENIFSGCDGENYLYIMDILYSCYNMKKLVGRRTIAEIARKSNVFLTEQEIRAKLKVLEMEGFVKIGIGRSGTRITPLGIDNFLQSKKLTQ